MRPSLVGFLAPLAFVAVGFAAAPHAGARDAREAGGAESGAAHRAEVRRIRAHFDSVLAELPARDVSALGAERRARRAALVATLRAYRDRGVFPHNYDFDAPTPYFVDRKTGTLCAVAHLLESTGRRDIVDRVARADNNVWVAELASDTALAGWLDAHGLTLAEAARIQVPYVEDGEQVAPGVSAPNRQWAVGSAAAMGLSLGTSLWNATRNASGRGRVANALGLTAGVAAFGLGVAGTGVDGASVGLNVANAVTGAASLWLSTRGFVRGHRSAVAKREAAARAATGREPVTTSIAPIVPLDGRAGAGVSVQVRF